MAVQLSISSTQLSERRSPLFLLNFNGREVQLSKSKLYQPLSRPDWSRLLKPAEEPAQKLHRTTEPQYQLDDFTGLRTAPQPLFPFHGRVTQLGLIILLGLAKTVYAILRDVYKFDLCDCDILVTSYLKVNDSYVMLFTVFLCMQATFSNLAPTNTLPKYDQPCGYSEYV